jgi:hypothetical protein
MEKAPARRNLDGPENPDPEICRQFTGLRIYQLQEQ